MCLKIVDTGISPILFGTAYRIKRKLQGHHEWAVQLNKRQNVPATTAIIAAATTVTITNNNTLLLILLFLLLKLIL
jgi:hypothetical protein